MGAPLLSVSDLKVHFTDRDLLGRVKSRVAAVDGVSFDIAEGETLGLVGESGSGKTTVARAVMSLVPRSSGRILIDGQDLDELSPAERRQRRRKLQIVFQDPFSSLNPRHRVSSIVRAALDIHAVGDKSSRQEAALALLEQVGIRRDQADDFPHQFSGGQRQRIAIARALILKPRLVVCDEPVSALDVSVQAQILNLLAKLQRDFHLSYLFVSHDLGVVAYITARVAVMYRGRIVEESPTDALFRKPLHPYTELLLASVPAAHPSQRRSLQSPIEVSSGPRSVGCAFVDRCPLALAKCLDETPVLSRREDGRRLACHAR